MNLIAQHQNRKEILADMTCAALARHDTFIGQYLDWLAGQSGQDRLTRQISMIAHSPASPVARAILARCNDLKRNHTSIAVIFAEMGSEGALDEYSEAIAGLPTGTAGGGWIRLAQNACLGDAHEQLILGTEMCWAGDSMRRKQGHRDALALFETKAPKAVRIGTLAFDAIWSIAINNIDVPPSISTFPPEVVPAKCHEPPKTQVGPQTAYGHGV